MGEGNPGFPRLSLNGGRQQIPRPCCQFSLPRGRVTGRQRERCVPRGDEACREDVWSRPNLLRGCGKFGRAASPGQLQMMAVSALSGILGRVFNAAAIRTCMTVRTFQWQARDGKSGRSCSVVFRRYSCCQPSSAPYRCARDAIAWNRLGRGSEVADGLNARAVQDKPIPGSECRDRGSASIQNSTPRKAGWPGRVEVQFQNHSEPGK